MGEPPENCTLWDYFFHAQRTSRCIRTQVREEACKFWTRNRISNKRVRLSDVLCRINWTRRSGLCDVRLPVLRGHPVWFPDTCWTPFWPGISSLHLLTFTDFVLCLKIRDNLMIIFNRLTLWGIRSLSGKYVFLRIVSLGLLLLFWFVINKSSPIRFFGCRLINEEAPVKVRPVHERLSFRKKICNENLCWFN